MPVIARLVQADDDTVRDAIHRVQRDRAVLPGASVGGRPSPPDRS
ncbi:hypothetical protein [Sinosporangium album]|nr:hypothetical protein [Sinosporangium album]